MRFDLFTCLSLIVLLGFAGTAATGDSGGGDTGYRHGDSDGGRVHHHNTHQLATADATGAIATVHPLATAAASRQLANGGNAIDAAIAAAVTLGVVDSYNSGIGGGLFALVRWADGDIEAIDAREMAPDKAHRDMYMHSGQVMSQWSREGALAVGIPGSVAAFDYLLQKGGSRSFAELLLPAATLAEEGFTVTPEFYRRLRQQRQSLAKFASTAAIFLNPDGRPWPIGHQLRQPELANTYRQLAKHGARYFYRGAFPLAVEQWMRAHGGIATAADFANYQLRLRRPVKSQFMGYDIYGFPPPSSGGVHVATILHILQNFELQNMAEVGRLHLLAEAMKLAFADRAHWLGDPDFAEVPRGLITSDYGRALAKKIDPQQVTAVPTHHIPPNVQSDLFDRHTTHIAVADSKGNWVAMTTTLNTSFGSKVVIPGTGVLLNNQMDDFAARPGVPNAYGLIGSEANRIQARKRPLSSMSPTIVLKGGEPMMTIGAAGGPMIISQVVQGLINHLLLRQPLAVALASPRIHQQWRPNLLFFDKKLSLPLRRQLTARGHRLRQLGYEGSTNAISQLNGRLVAVSEPRIKERNNRQRSADDSR